MSDFTHLTSSDGFRFPAYVARPEGTARGALVVLQEIFGVNSHIRSVADRWAARGYLVVAPATFARVQGDVDLGYTPDDMKVGGALKAGVEALPAPGVQADIQAAIDHAARESGGTKVGLFGFCWGGLLTWRAAAQLNGLSAAVSYYGGGMTTPAEIARQPKVPLMAHFADRDTHIPVESVKALEQAHPEIQVFLYAADHGFNCDQRGSYDAAAAQLADERTEAFFAQHLA
ncbi:dienelactone hydrolase family protein [Diaphorobacter aerolatus]|uniref:Dienelactone hydrolase family protein n=1 Tax=Diaphorobacter aerolatus TaxID=1288495 RepID=A0A7H0GFP5_9BURK|nr:dienelactone hydrolase family protein [Diaphorobacter aerolatus]QNP47111.1 dienelactone hydrolase family protein [Diaphorobacter aerolatus]